MAKKLVLIESPGKLASFKKYLGPDFDIVPTFGHCLDLPEDELAVDIKKNFETKITIKEDHEDVIKSIRTLAKKASHIYLMTDEDREGEAIGYNIYNEIKDDTKAVVYRSVTNEITSKGILKAIANPSDIDMNKVDAQFTRRILDRLCGYKTSYLTKMATGGRSAGRVQSAILRIIADRELEILAFKPEEYWILIAYLLSSKGESFTAEISSKIEIKNETQATKIFDNVIKSQPFIKAVEAKQVKSSPYPPFTTLPMIAAASSVFGWSAKKTMSVAQSIYEAGLSTYHRTDSPVISEDALSGIRDYITSKFGKSYLPDSAKKYAAKKGAQEAHECCRPTNIEMVDPHISDSDQKKLYEMIWKRTVASQMMDGKDERTKVVTKIGDYDFISNGKVQIFDGYRKCWTYSSSEDTILPPLKEGEKCSMDKLDKEQKFTTPPNRFSDASLSKKCEEEQIARPATFASFIETLKDRGYMKQKGKSFEATELGLKVTKFLVDADICFVNIKFTAELETLLDEIQEGGKTRVDVLNKFWTRLKEDIERGKDLKKKNEISEYKCPKCDGFLLRKNSLFGEFYSCQNYKQAKKAKDGTKIFPEGSCQYIAKVGEGGVPVEKVEKIKEYAAFDCQKCKSKMIKRSSKYGDFYGCSGFPACRMTADMEGVFKDNSGPKKKFKKFGKFKKKIKGDE